MNRCFTAALLSLALSHGMAGAAPNTPDAGSTSIQMRNLVVFPYPDVAAEIASLDGTAKPTHEGHPIDLDDVASYSVTVASASMRLDAHDMTVLMNRHILPLGNSPIKHVDVTFANGELHMSGSMQKLGATVPFTATATVAPTQGGDMRVHITSMRAGDVVPKSMMDFLGLDLSNIAQPANQAAFHLEGDDMVVPLSAMFPPPIFAGPITSLRLTPDGLYTTVGRTAAASTRPQPHSILAMHCGTVVFGRLTMQDAEIAMVPLNPGRNLGFSPRDYYAQMQGGQVAPQPDQGLVAHVADFRDLPRER